MAPPLRELGLKANGKLNSVATQGMLPFDVYAGVGTGAIVVAAGDYGQRLGNKALGYRGGGKAPFLAMAYDYGKFLELKSQIESMSRSGQTDDDRDALAGLQNAEAEIDANLAKLFGRAMITLDVTDKGLVFWGAVEMK